VDESTLATQGHSVVAGMYPPTMAFAGAQIQRQAIADRTPARSHLLHFADETIGMHAVSACQPGHP
jgi:hypothetical protein